MRTGLTIVAWLGVLVCSILGFALQVLILPYTALFDRRRNYAGRIFRGVAVVASKLNPLWTFGVVGSAERDLGAAVVVSNHCSHADSFLISHLPFEMKWLGKKSLFSIPIVGWSMRLSGDIPLVRGDKSSVKQAMKACRNYLAQDMPIMMFPEGTRSRSGTIGEFKDGAFRLAMDADVPVIPIAVSGTETALRKADWRFGRAHALVMVGAPIAVHGRTLADIKEEAFQAVTSLKKELDARLNREESGQV
ncbi:MAG: lysophospholipid acyltransferase family protein [Myxococcota bacterium]|nr:lysophospholipid acyltransferase family protein [Myxococcota bacterium]